MYVGTAESEPCYREGRVIRRLPEVDEPGRMAQLLIAIDDPLGLISPAKGTTPLLLRAYVRARVMGRSVPSAAAVPREV